MPDARSSRSGSRWGRSPGRYPAVGLSCSSLRQVRGAARRDGTQIRSPTPSRTRRRRRRRPASQPRRRRRQRPRSLPPRVRTTHLQKVSVREGPRRLGGASETRARGSRPRPLGRVLGGRETRAGGVRIRGLLRAACGEDGCEPKAAEGAAEPCAPGRSRPRGAISGAGIGPGA